MTDQTTTIDGTTIEPGLAVWDYNLKATTVVRPTPHSPGWWDTANGGMFDGGRMWVRHPATGKPATAALAEEAEAISDARFIMEAAEAEIAFDATTPAD